ncbi:MAG: RidA family protein [Atopobiaceae bacterium]|jgi:2-iminobutanoate/2-iminopropanoate deaminase
MKYAISAADVPDALGSYSQGTTAGRLIFSSGQLGRSAQDNSLIVEGGIVAETERICDIFETLLAEVNCTLDDIASTTIYLVDLDYAPLVDGVLSRRFSKPGPARTLVEVSALPMGARIEMDFVACR